MERSRDDIGAWSASDRTPRPDRDLPGDGAALKSAWREGRDSSISCRAEWVATSSPTTWSPCRAQLILHAVRPDLDGRGTLTARGAARCWYVCTLELPCPSSGGDRTAP